MYMGPGPRARGFDRHRFKKGLQQRKFEMSAGASGIRGLVCEPKMSKIDFFRPKIRLSDLIKMGHLEHRCSGLAYFLAPDPLLRAHGTRHKRKSPTIAQ